MTGVLLRKMLISFHINQVAMYLSFVLKDFSKYINLLQSMCDMIDFIWYNSVQTKG